MALAKAGRLEEAERDLRLLLGGNPADPRLRMSLGNVLFNRGDHAGAAREFEAVAAAHPRHAAARLWLGSARIFLGAPEEAIEPLRESIAIDPSVPTAHKLLGIALVETSVVRLGANAVRTDLLAEGVRSLEKACSLAPGDGEAWTRLGMARDRARDRKGAEEALRRAASLDPKSPTPRLELGVLLFERGESAEAQRFLAEAAERAPADPRPWWRIGMLLAQRGDHAAAAQAFERSVSLDATFLEGRYALAGSLLRAGRKEEGRAEMERFQRESKKEDRIEDLEGTVRSEPGNVAARFALGARYAARGDTDRASLEMRRVLAREPTHADAAGMLGLLLAREGKYAEAEPHLRRALGGSRDEGLVCYGLGVCLVNTGRMAEAREPYERAARLRPDDPLVHHNLGGVRILAGDLPGAEASFRTAARLQPGNPESWKTLAQVLQRMGKQAEAREAEAEAARREKGPSR